MATMHCTRGQVSLATAKPRSAFSLLRAPCCPGKRTHLGLPLRSCSRVQSSAQEATTVQLIPRLWEGSPQISVSSGVYLAIELVVLLAQLALVDAAFSGDWSRTGVIAKELEPVLQNVVYFIIAAHSVTAVLAARLASTRGLSTVVIAIKAFLFGTLEVWRVSQLPETIQGKK